MSEEIRNEAAARAPTAPSDEGAIDAVIGHARDAGEMASHLARDIAGRTVEAMGRAYDAGNDAVRAAGDATWSVARQVRAGASDMADEAYRHGGRALAAVERRPWAAVLAAVAIGGAALGSGRAARPWATLGLGLTVGGAGWAVQQKLEALRKELSAARARLERSDDELVGLRRALRERADAAAAREDELRRAADQLAAVRRQAAAAEAARDALEARLRVRETELDAALSIAGLGEREAAAMRDLHERLGRGVGVRTAAASVAGFDLDNVETARATIRRADVQALIRATSEGTWRASVVRWLLGAPR